MNREKEEIDDDNDNEWMMNDKIQQVVSSILREGLLFRPSEGSINNFSDSFFS